jgi:predicted nucleic-acid-binding Zn-ribbon protein
MEQSEKKTLICPLCDGQDFNEDKVVLPKYGLLRLTDYKAKIFICKKCHNILLFEEGDTFFLGVD